MLNRVAAPPARGTRRPTAPAARRIAKRRRPPLWRNPVMVAAAAVVVALGVIVALSTRGDQPAPAAASTGTRVVDAVTRVDPAVVAAVGSGGVAPAFVPLKAATPLAAADGRPQVLYVGAEFCPFCAAQRWSLVNALSRFGSFDHLSLSTSSSTDSFPDTPTLTFHGATYASTAVDFVAVELSDREGRPMETLTAAQKQLMATYDMPPYVAPGAAGGIPWLDVANQRVMVSSGYSPQLLAGLSWEDVAARLGDAKDPVTQAVVGNANTITAAVCRATGMQPASVCGVPAVAQIAAALP